MENINHYRRDAVHCVFTKNHIKKISFHIYGNYQYDCRDTTHRVSTIFFEVKSE